MPGKAMKCIVEVDVHVITCPGTFLHAYEYVYLQVQMLGLEARTKSVPPTFPLFYHQRFKFEKTFYDCPDPGLVVSMLKGEDTILELRQHTDYIGDGKVISHCSSNTHEFLYPAISPYYGSGREILLYKTSKFKPIRVTGEPVKLEYSTKTVIKEVPDDNNNVTDMDPVVTSTPDKLNRSSVTFAKSKSKSLPNLTQDDDLDGSEFVVRRKDDKVLSNRDFSTYTRPKPRKSMSPIRSSRRSPSPSRSKSVMSSTKANATVENIPAGTGKYTSLLNSSLPRLKRSTTEPLYSSTTARLRDALDELEIADARRRYNNRYRTYTSPNLVKALSTSKRIQRRVDDLVLRKEVIDSEVESDLGLDILRESLREERNALNEAIKEADREAFYRSLNRTR